MLGYLVMQSAGMGLGVFLGCLIGLGIRARKGNVEGLVAGSVVLTALLAGFLGLGAGMVWTYLRLPG